MRRKSSFLQWHETGDEASFSLFPLPSRHLTLTRFSNRVGRPARDGRDLGARPHGHPR